MSAIDFEGIRARVSLPIYCEQRGIQLKRTGNKLIGKCPIHQEQHGASFVVFPDGKWHCFGKCQTSGDVIDLERAIGGGNIKDAIQRLDGSNPIPQFRTPSGRTQHKQNWQKEQADEQHRLRKVHPTLKTLSNDELRELSERRSIAVEALKIASDRKFLLCKPAFLSSDVAWVITDKTRHCYLARRLDGEPWDHLLSKPKAYVLPGGQASWPIGIREAAGYPAIALCEGGPDFLSAFACAWADEVEDLVAPVCMSSASVRIADEALQYFAGKRVRIFMHDDAAGRKACLKWNAQLKDIAKVDGFRFDGLVQSDGQPVADLNDLCRIDCDCWEANRQIIDSVMAFAKEGVGKR
jgi:hypothetical protein